MGDTAFAYGVPFVVMLNLDLHSLDPRSTLESVYEQIGEWLAARQIPMIDSFSELQPCIAGREQELWIREVPQ